MDVSQYLEIFIDETKEHLETLSDQLMILETEPENMDTINEIFRAAHSLKGMAGTMGYKRMQRLTHDMENVFQEVRSGNMTVKPELVDVLFRGLDALEAYLANILESADEGTEDNEDIINTLNRIAEGGEGDSDSEDNAGEAKSQTSSSEVGAEKYKLMRITDYEHNTFEKAKADNSTVYGITVYLMDTCILKAARAFLVFKALEELGEVVKSVPDIQDIEDEKFELDFSLIYITKESLETVKAAIENVSEIKEVVIGQFDAVLEESGATEQSMPEPEVKKEESAEPKTETPASTAGGGQAAAKAAPKKDDEKKAPAKTAAKPAVGRTVRVDIEKLDVLMNLVSELIIAKNGLVSISSSEEGRSNDSSFNEQIEYLESVTTNLHESVMKVRMVPIESVVSRFPRMIRDLNKKLGKKMELHMSGEETELDRTVIDEIGDPLQHLLRNAADHGLESNEERVALGKEEVGNIYLNAYQDGNNVNIEVRDDGAGINVDKVRNKALNKGTITQEQADNMSDNEIIDLLFQPSFSTAEQITDVSGRGVGLDVVKTKVEGLGGNIECKSVLGEGSSFVIRLPLTLAIIQALMVEVGAEKYAIPLGNIQTIEDVMISEVKFVQTKEVINLRGTVIPLIRLEQLLDVEPVENENENLTVVIVKKGDKLAGLVVDNLIGQQEIVIKSIGDYIHCSKIIGGATILGDGEIALILEVNAMV